MRGHDRQTRTAPEQALSLRQALSFRYLGLGFFWAWCYCLWFVPRVSTSTSLTSASANNLWLLTMVFAAILHFLIPVMLGEKRRLSQYKWPYYVAPVFMSAGSGVLFMAIIYGQIWLGVLCTVVLGLSSALLWNLWGEFYACAPYNITFAVAPAFAATLLGSLLLTSLFPTFVADMFVCFIPLLSGMSLNQARKLNYEATPPILLPKAVQQVGWATILKVCIISSLACSVVTFLWALLPEIGFELSDTSMALGCSAGAIFMVLVYILGRFVFGSSGITTIYPWVLVIGAAAFCLFLLGPQYYLASYIISMGVSVVIDVFLVLYFGTFTSNGYTRPSISFGYSEGFVCVAMVVGSLVARFVAFSNSVINQSAALLSIILLMCLLIALLREEFGIAAIMTTKPGVEDISIIVENVAAEFALSNREQEILALFAQGYSATGIADKLVISPYTVQTHIKHIYTKMHIHKKSDLLAYIDRQRIQ